jgi:hypothetical protein
MTVAFVDSCEARYGAGANMDDVQLNGMLLDGIYKRPDVV